MTPAASRLNFQPIRTRRVHEEICSQVLRSLSAGRLKPGDKLPGVAELAQEFGVSRAGVREALHALEHAGIVALHRGARGGAFIQQWEALAA
jgi:DNA-binding FadR family transcriptional regulator